MCSRTFCKCVLTIVILLAFATAGRAQVTPTPEQIDFVSGLAKRILSKLQEEVTTLQRQQLQPAITAEQQVEGTPNNLAGQASRIAGRIECLNWLVREYPRIRVNMDQTAIQQIAALRRELAQLNQQLRNVNTQLNQATTLLNNARERRLAAERNVASKQATNMQQFTDLRYLYDMSRLSPPRFNWDTMMERITAVAREKQLTSNVTISTGAVPVTVGYQLVSGGQTFSAAKCTKCVVRLPVGNYNFWVETTGSAEPHKTAYLIFAESHSIQINQANPNTQ